MRISGTDIYIAQGDSATLTLSFEEAQTGLQMWISSVKSTIPAEGPILDNNLYHYSFEIINTHTSDAGNFNYDIFKTDSDSDKQTTIIRNSLFVVEPTARMKYADQTSSQTEGINPEKPEGD